jgi:hypothetical protein
MVCRKRAALVVTAIIATAAPAAWADRGTHSAPGERTPLLGFAGERQLRLVPLDPLTLRPSSGTGIAVGSGGCAPREGGSACWTIPPWALSTSGTLALAENAGYKALSLRLVDVARMRVTARFTVGGGPIGALLWLTQRRLLAVQEICCSEAQRVLAIDAGTGRITARRPLGGTVIQLTRTRTELVMLVAPAQRVGPAKLVVADGSGLTSIPLAQLAAGSKLLPSETHRVDQRLPGLAIDPATRRAFVVGSGLVAVVDLNSLAVSYHPVGLRARRPASVETQHKTASGYFRSTRWLGGGLLAIAGSDTEANQSQPTGLVLVDTRRWSARTVDEGATGFVLADRLLLATGSTVDSNGGTTSIGLAAYGFDGIPRFRLFEGRNAWMAQAYGGRAYVGVARADGSQEPLQVVELGTGRVVADRAEPLPWLLLGTGSAWWGDL